MRFGLTLLVLACLTTACNKAKSRSRVCSTPSTVKAFSYSPIGFPVDFDSAPQFFAEIEQMDDSGTVVETFWRDDLVAGTDAGTVPETTALVAEAHELFCFSTAFVFSWRLDSTLFIGVPSDMTNDWSNTDAVALFQAMLVDFATTYTPKYIFLGSENDFYYEQDPVDYANWLTAYNGFYDAIKAVSPDTLVGPSFSFDHMAGAGGHVGWNSTHWNALENHDTSRMDVVGVTFYPFFEYETVADMPSNHMAPFFSRTGSTPVVFLGTGWPAEDLGNYSPAWTPSESEQVDFVSALFSIVGSKTVPLMNWLFLNEMVDDGFSSTYWKIFGSVSLKDSDGTARAAYADWLAR